MAISFLDKKKQTILFAVQAPHFCQEGPVPLTEQEKTSLYSPLPGKFLLLPQVVKICETFCHKGIRRHSEKCTERLGRK
jgi:hypothetical protein